MKERNYSIDLLRLISMLFIIFLHILGTGGVTLATESFSLNYEVCWIMEFVALCGVNCFALVSGYVGINAKSYKYSNLVTLWLRVLFYSVGITVLCKLIMPDDVSTKQVIFSFFPVLKNRYWYFTSYVGLFIFIPLINKGINALNQKQTKYLAYGVLGIFSICSVVGNGLRLDTGYSALWLIIMYVVGAYFGKYDVLKKIRMRYSLLGFVVNVAISVFLENILNADLPSHFNNTALQLIAKVIDKGVDMLKLFSYTFPTVVLASIFLLAFFLKLKLHKPTQKVVKFLTPMAFSVYLIHANKSIYDNVLTDRFAEFAGYSTSKMVLFVVLSAVIIYIICIGIDFIRYLIFEKLLKVKDRLYKLERKIIKNVWK